MTTADEKIFIDTNVLIHATNQLSEWHDKALYRLRSLRDDGVEMYISTQMLREYIAVATRNAIEKKDFSLSEVVQNIDIFQKEFRVIEETLYTISSLTEIIQKYSVSGKQVHDANIVASMKSYGLKNLLTHNKSDFVRYNDQIKIVELN